MDKKGEKKFHQKLPKMNQFGIEITKNRLKMDQKIEMNSEYFGQNSILIARFAGTRYKRRGVDVDGHVANYVETEQILLYHHYALSFLQV